jgi:hypothetical protein
MKVKLSPAGEKWRCGEDDVTRHSIIYALIDLTRMLVDVSLEDDAIVERLVGARASMPQRQAEGFAPLDDHDPGTIVPLGDWSFDPDDESGAGPPAHAFLGGFADTDSFFLILSAGIFEASVQLMYERAEGELQFIGGYVPLFKGDTMQALHWLQDHGDALLDTAAGEADAAVPEAVDRPTAATD